ncbi:hypothetical protein [Halomonas salinarum]|uniref:hypothetical protein n=1 Tax=Halomonas salinarum TaxID=1158993 RepID=UPI00143B4A8A|nr:hypothetical protein [Halomonas salinarum]
MEQQKSNSPPFSPRDFLRKRRPERFSDSIVKEVGKLDRAVLEHQLSTLNRRNMELAFEDFAKQLCEKIICPNLLEQTGPVAGGDGKVDSQTFPVSEQSKALWYVGVNENSHEERWAFAVSTQEDWKKKCRKDVRKIAGTQRGYKKAFFITSTYTKSNQRSELEDSLTKETGIDVRILDVSWIMDQTFKHGYEQLAIDTLSIDVDWRREVETGANDYSKNIRIKELDEKIKHEIDTSNILPHQLDWLLEVAVLSKEIEKASIETHGLFTRAISASERFGNSYHKFDAHYQYAWAAYWWFEDINLFREQLQICFCLAKEIGQSSKWGDAVTLIGLYSSYYRNVEIEKPSDVESIISEAKDELSALAKEEERPSNSLMSKAYIELLNLQSLHNIEQASDIFSSLLSIAKDGEELIGFSFEEIYNIVTELDFVFGDIDSYEKLLDYFTEHATYRYGEVSGALIWLRRGAKRLESNEPYQAIKLIGKSLAPLYKQETKKDLYAALNILSSAYMQAGLLWASRANLLFSASMVTDEFWKTGDFISAQAHSYMRLAKIDLQIGRIEFALTWWNLACIVSTQIEEEVLSENEIQTFDAYLSQCILNTRLDELSSATRLPELLDNNQLFFSSSSLLYALGHEDIVESEYKVEINQEHIDFLKLVRDTDLGAPIPEVHFIKDRYTFIKSTVMGCEIRVYFPFRSPLLELAETLLSSIEAFFSTGMVDRVVIFESRFDIEITADDDDEVSISHELDDSGSILKMEVLCSSFTPRKLGISGQSLIQEWLKNFLIETFANLAHPKEIESTLESMLGKDRALERSVSFGSCFVILQNILGDDAVKNVKSLLEDERVNEYTLLRSCPWDQEFPKPSEDERKLTELEPGEGEPPEPLTRYESHSHSSIKVQGLIKVRLWNKTVWQATGFAIYPDGTPEIILAFENEAAARKIFRDLKLELGDSDKKDRLRISIIQGINKRSPAHYRVCISENVSHTGNGLVQLACKMKTMTPTNNSNLETFIKAYNKKGFYKISYASIKNGEIVTPSASNRITISKNKLNIIEEWRIGQNDLEVVAIQEDDDPIIPEGIENPPIQNIINRKR